MMKSKAFLSLLVVVLCGCPRPDSAPKLPPMESTTAQESNTALESRPSVRPIAEDAAVLRKLLGYDEVIAYEFRGAWLKCWLECEVDGDVVACTPKHVVSPRWFGSDAKVQPREAEKVIGWITVFGDAREELNLHVRAKLPRNDAATRHPLMIRSSLRIPELPDELVKKGVIKVGTPLEAGWTNREHSLPGIANQPVALQSCSWTEKTRRDWSKAPDPHQPDPYQKVLRQVKVTLYCAEPDDDEDISPTAVRSTDLDPTIQ